MNKYFRVLSLEFCLQHPCLICAQGLVATYVFIHLFGWRGARSQVCQNLATGHVWQTTMEHEGRRQTMKNGFSFRLESIPALAAENLSIKLQLSLGLFLLPCLLPVTQWHKQLKWDDIMAIDPLLFGH